MGTRHLAARGLDPHRRDTLEIEELGLSPGQYTYGMGVDQNGNMWVGSFSSSSSRSDQHVHAGGPQNRPTSCSRSSMSIGLLSPSSPISTAFSATR